MKLTELIELTELDEVDSVDHREASKVKKSLRSPDRWKSQRLPPLLVSDQQSPARVSFNFLFPYIHLASFSLTSFARCLAIFLISIFGRGLS